MMGNKTSGEKPVTGIIDGLRKKLQDVQGEIAKLECKESKTMQEHVKANEEQTPSDPEKGNFEKVKMLKGLLNSWLDQLDNLEEKKDDANRQGKSSPGVSSAKNRKVAIQLYCAQATDLTDYAVRELETKLSSKQIQEGMKFTVQTCKTLSSIQTGIPLIVICLNSSRLGVDVSNAISGVPTESNTALLIFHHHKLHALPTQPSNTILTKAEVGNVGIVIDVAFFEKMGLYECEMNRDAYRRLITFFEVNCKM